MAERDMLFTWDLQSFNENLDQFNDLLSLRIEFERKNFSTFPQPTDLGKV